MPAAIASAGPCMDIGHGCISFTESFLNAVLDIRADLIKELRIFAQ